MHNFKDFKVWQKAVDFAVNIYQITVCFLVEDLFGRTSQMRKAGVSIPSNIAEGSARTSKKAFANSLEISLGESFELETQMEFAKLIGYLDAHQMKDLDFTLSEIQRMLFGLKSSLEH